MFHVKQETRIDARSVRVEDFERIASEVLAPAQARACAERLFAHFRTLATWSAVHDLVGPGTVADLLTRHYAESLAAVPLLPQRGVLVDVGSGAGFPGFVLACARPDLQVILVEPRGKRLAFLRAAARAAGGLEVETLGARVSAPLPVGLPRQIDIVTIRALRLEEAVVAALGERLGAGGRWLAWGGPRAGLPASLAIERSFPLPGRDAARIIIGRSLHQASATERGQGQEWRES